MLFKLHPDQWEAPLTDFLKKVFFEGRKAQEAVAF